MHRSLPPPDPALRSFVVDGARLVLPDRVVKGDLRVEDGVIAEIAPHVSGGRRVDGRDRLLLPGAVDTDFGWTRADELPLRTRAALRGGVTAIVGVSPAHDADAPLASAVPLGAWFAPRTPDEPVPERVRGLWLDGRALFDPAFEPLLAAQTLPVVVENRDPARDRERATLYGEVPGWADHARIHDVEGGAGAVRRAMELARKYGTRLHLAQVSTAEELLRIAHAPDRVTAAVRLANLVLDDAVLATLGAHGIVWPPLRGFRHAAALWEGLAAGVVEIVSSGDRHVRVADKEVPYPATPEGAPAAEWLLPLLLAEVHEGRCTLPELARVSADAPARLARLARKGRLEVGFDADLVLVDPAVRDAVGAVHSPAGFTPFAGRPTGGRVEQVWVGGDLALEGDEIRPTAPRAL